jgi:hypothetical protein
MSMGGTSSGGAFHDMESSQNGLFCSRPALGNFYTKLEGSPIVSPRSRMMVPEATHSATPEEKGPRIAVVLHADLAAER